MGSVRRVCGQCEECVGNVKSVKCEESVWAVSVKDSTICT